MRQFSIISAEEKTPHSQKIHKHPLVAILVVNIK